MLMLTQAPSGALPAKACCSTSSSRCSLTFATPQPSLFSSRWPSFISARHPSNKLTLAKADDAIESSSSSPATKQPHLASPPFDDSVFVGPDSVPLEGVIQFEKPSLASPLKKWGRVALLAGGDVVALLVFAAIGRFNHGLPAFDLDTLRTADPFVAGWFLAAYFLGGFSEDGRGENGLFKGVISVTKSWALGIPLGLSIRAMLSGHIPPYSFIFVTLGSTAVLLNGWRTLFYSVLPSDKSKKSDVYRRGSPFELFELLTSLIRRW